MLHGGSVVAKAMSNISLQHDSDPKAEQKVFRITTSFLCRNYVLHVSPPEGWASEGVPICSERSELLSWLGGTLNPKP